MKAIMVMFDTLNRRMLPPYGCEWVHAPNFERLARRSVTFDNCYGGSMPCMPARRELHSGRYNFLHRGWGPLEPFDDSVPEMLKRHDVHTHLTTDHQHYWEDGGSTYHGRYSTFEFFRGQEGDPWKGHVSDPVPPEDHKRLKGKLWRQDWINREYLANKLDHPQTKVFDAGLDFIQKNHVEDRWFLQVEAFDPHEPFFSYDEHKKLYTHNYTGPNFDWPDYERVTEEAEVVRHVRNEYAALLSMCDESLGRVLDAMDNYEMWQDTMLIVCTDHGFLLGEHQWWGKTVQPWYNETIHTPLFIWDPRTDLYGVRRKSLVQTIDLGPTLLDFFGLACTNDMQGKPLRDALSMDTPVREAGLFGIFGGHVNVTDGRYVYMRASADASNQPLFEYTLMPTRMRGLFPVSVLREAELVNSFGFTKAAPTLRVPASTWCNPWQYGSVLYDLQSDPTQQRPLVDDDLELRMASLMATLMTCSQAPEDQFIRLGLPMDGKVETKHLLVRSQWPQVQESLNLPA